MSLLARAQTALGVTQLGRVLAAIALCSTLSATLGAGGGFWAGMRWQQGADAIADRSELRGELASLRIDVAAMQGEALRLRNAGVVIADEFRRAHRRQLVLDQQHEARIDALDRMFGEWGLAVEEWSAANRAALDGCRLGPDGMRLWSAAARGAAVAGAAADSTPGSAAGPARGMPRDAAGAAERSGHHGAADLDQSSGSVPPLPRAPSGAGASPHRVPR